MARGYPRFLFSNPSNTLDQGPFIVHTLDPFIVCRITDQLVDNTVKNIRKITTAPQYEYHLILLSEAHTTVKINKIMDDMQKWAKAQIINKHISFDSY